MYFVIFFLSHLLFLFVIFLLQVSFLNDSVNLLHVFGKWNVVSNEKIGSPADIIYSVYTNSLSNDFKISCQNLITALMLPTTVFVLFCTSWDSRFESWNMSSLRHNNAPVSVSNKRIGFFKRNSLSHDENMLRFNDIVYEMKVNLKEFIDKYT